MNRLDPGTFKPKHFRWSFDDGIATVTLDRPERKNPLTFESYAELRDMFRALSMCRRSRSW
jgi:enoyl-CoA hydratase/carnithine racemase